MILFVSDLHHDHDPPAGSLLLSESLADERALVECLKYYRDRLDHVVLLGDLFDAYLETRHTVPKGLTRLLGILSDWADSGLSVSLFVGNHDPWHRDWFERGLGFSVYRQSEILTLAGRRVFVGHGDIDERGGASLGVKVTRHPWALKLFTGLLPGDSGLRLARWTSRKLRTRTVDPSTRYALRAAADEVLDRTDADTVVFGHCHVPESSANARGHYLNCGAWPLTKTYVIMDDGEATLHRWTSAGPAPFGGD